MVSPSATPVTIPSWISLGQVITGIGAILIFIGFIFGAVALSSIPTSVSNYQGDLETFFVLAGLGILLAIGGWLFDSVWPKYRARPRPTPPVVAPSASVPAPTTMAPAPPPPPPPLGNMPAPPNCPNCGKPTTYVAQYGRYYCFSCARYA